MHDCMIKAMAFEKPVVVIDNGSYILKAGFACDNHPVSMFRTVVGRPNYLCGSYGKEYYDVYIGDEAVAKIDDLELSRPIVKGRIVHWDNMERIWHHIFYRELKAAPEDRAVILACSLTTPMKDKIKCCEVFFETLNSPGLCVQSQAVLSLYGSGFTTGISVDLGHDSVDIVPVYEGGLISYAHMQTNYASVDISKFITDSLRNRNISLGDCPAEGILDGIKKKLYLTQNVAVSRKNSRREYELPNGDKIDITMEAFMAAEMMFQPELVKGFKTEVMPLQEAVVTSAMKCDAELRPELYEAVVPCGGVSMIPGLDERLATEIENITQKPVSVLSSSEAYAVAWLGGATFAGMPASKKMWVSRKQYDDYGEKIIRNKFM